MKEALRLLPAPVDAVSQRFAPALGSPGPADGVTDPALSSLTGPDAGRGRQLLRPLLWLLLGAVATQSFSHVVNVWAFEGSISRLHADDDGSLAGWLGTVTTWSVASAAALIALLLPAVRLPLLVVAAISAFLSLDDMIVLHEIVARVAIGYDVFPHDGYLLWPLVYLPLMSLLGWLLLRTARTVDVGNGRFLVAGLACLVVAVVLEATAPVLYALGSDHNQPLYESEVLLEEALETSGWGMIAFGLLATVADLLMSRGAMSAAGAPRPDRPVAE